MRRHSVREHKRSNGAKVRAHVRGDEDPRDRHMRAMRRPLTKTFYLEELGPYNGHDTGFSGAGGFAIPAFDEATTMQILRDVERMNEPGMFKWRRVAVPGRHAHFIVTEDGESHALHPDSRGLYEVGQGNWTWSPGDDA